MKTMIPGTGCTGRDFVNELLRINQVEVIYFDASSVMVGKSSEKKEYAIHVLGAEELSTHMEGVQAHPLYDIDALCSRWKEADFLFTARGGENMGGVGETLAKAFKRLVEENVVHVSDIIACGNWIDLAKDSEEAIISSLNEEEHKLFEESIGVSKSVIMCTGTGALDPDKVVNEMDTWIQNMWYLSIDRDRIKGEISQQDYVEFVADFGDLLKQKIYTSSTSVTTVSYLGKLRGLVYMTGSANDPKIEPILDQVCKEISYALIHGMGIDEESQIKFSKTTKAKYTDRATVDLVIRIARDPIRKLEPQDRFIGPMRIALSAGIRPKAIALGAATTLYFDNPGDHDAPRLKEICETKGVDYTLETVSEIDPQGKTVALIRETIAELRAKG